MEPTVNGLLDQLAYGHSREPVVGRKADYRIQQGPEYIGYHHTGDVLGIKGLDRNVPGQENGSADHNEGGQAPTQRRFQHIDDVPVYTPNIKAVPKFGRYMGDQHR